MRSWQQRQDVNTFKIFFFFLMFVQHWFVPVLEHPDQVRLQLKLKNLEQRGLSAFSVLSLSLHPVVYYLISPALGHTATLNGPRPHGQ